MNYLICIVAYNRILPLKRLLDSIIRADYPRENRYDLMISIDHSEFENRVISICQSVLWDHGNKIIKTYSQNMGLKKHMLKCISYVNEYDGIFLLEDDLIVSKYYTHYIRDTEKLSHDTHVGGIALYSYGCNEFSDFKVFKAKKTEYDIYAMKLPCSWGEYWNREQGLAFVEWCNSEMPAFDWSEIPNAARVWGSKSWKKLFYVYLVLFDKYILYPYFSFSTNMSEAGVHNISPSNVMQAYLSNDGTKLNIPVFFDELVRYDSYMESEELKQSYPDTTIDLYGTRVLEEIHTRYLLSSRVYDYRILEKWELSVLPLELSIEMRITGEGFYLYDLQCKEKNYTRKRNLFMNYFPYNRGIWKDHCIMIWSNIKMSLANKAKKIFKSIKP